MKPFNDTYVMYQLLEFVDENSIICLCKANKKLNEICKQYIELEDNKRFEIHVTESYRKKNDSLQKYCMNNDVIKIRKMFGIYLDWNIGLYGACRCGNIEIAKLMIKKGARDWNWGSDEACWRGHIDMVKFMIKKGGDNWESGLFNACLGGHIDIVKLMIEKGATECWNCRKSMKEHLAKK